MEVAELFTSFFDRCTRACRGSLTLLFLAVSLQSFSQQSDVYNQFFMNPYLYNPAYAGVEGHTAIYLLYNQKWTNVQDAPTISHVSFHTPLKGGIGIGAAAYNVSQGLLTRSQGKFSASYLVTMDRQHHLRFGMSVGGGNQSLSFGELDDPTDPAFIGIADQSSYMLADFGATYHFGHFNVGFSIPNLVGYDVIGSSDIAPIRVKPLDNLMLKMNYRGHITDDVAIEPHIIYRYSDVTPGQYEATAIFHVYHVVWAGLTYRQDNNFGITVGTKIKEKIGVGVSYETGNTKVSSLLGPTFEGHIGIHLGTKKEHHAHVSSFIKSHRLTAEERAEKARLEREQQLQALQQSRQTQQDSGDELSVMRDTPQTQEQPADEPPATEAEPDAPVVSDWKQDTEYEEVHRTNDFGEEEKAVVIEHINENGEKEMAVAWVPKDENWVLDKSEQPLKRTSSDGQQEIGVKYTRTNTDGTEEVIVKWEVVVTPDQAASILAGANVVETLAEVPAEIPEDQPDTTTFTERQVPVETQEDPAITGTGLSQIETPPVQTPVVTPPVETPVVETPVVETPQVQEPPEQTEVVTEDPAPATDTRTHDEIAASGEPLEVKRGNNMLELPVGNYVVAGAFESFQHAEDYSDEMFNKGYVDTIVGYSSARGYYYVVIYRSSDLQSATNEKDRVKTRSGMEKVWVLKVSE